MTTIGYVETRFSYGDFSQSAWQTTERFRSTSKWYLNDALKIEITPQVSITQGRYNFGEYLNTIETPLQEQLGVSLDQIIEDCDWELEREREINELSDLLTLPRLFLDIQTEKFDLRVGKQALNWGAGQFFNPTNILNENLLATPWQERAGLYAVKTTIPLPKEQEIRFIASSQELSSEEIFLTGMYRININNIDISFVSSSNFQESMLGANVKGDAGVGYWLESAYSFDDSIADGMIEITTGMDYSFALRHGLILSSQIFYDSSGETAPKYYDWKARQPLEFFLPSCAEYPNLYQAPPKEIRQTLGRLYNLSSARLLWNEHWSMQLFSLLNLNDQTGFIYPNAQILLGSHWQFSSGVQFLIGKDGEFVPNIDSLPLNTDELIPHWTSISWLRYSF